MTIQDKAVKFNFEKDYLVGFPFGINVFKTEKRGFSLELVPFIQVNDSISKVSNLLIHPGLFFKIPNKITLYTRLAFEITGRYGFTLSASKIVYQSKNSTFFISTPIPFRFGNNKRISVGFGIQLGLTL